MSYIVSLYCGTIINNRSTAVHIVVLLCWRVHVQLEEEAYCFCLIHQLWYENLMCVCVCVCMCVWVCVGVCGCVYVGGYLGDHGTRAVVCSIEHGLPCT